MLGKRLINTVAGAAPSACTTDTLDLAGMPSGGESNVAVYKLDGDATDVTGNYNGTFVNPAYGVGKFGQAAVFNGSSSKVVLGSLSQFSSNTVSFSLWFNSTSVSTTAILIGSNQNALFAGELDLYTYNSGFLLTVATASNVYRQWTTPANLSNNTWHNVVVALDSGTSEVAKIYLDGNEQTKNIIGQSGIISGALLNSASNLNLGVDNVPASYFTGSIDQIRIYNQALSQANVDTLYNEVQCPCTTDTVDYPTTNLAYYKLDGNVEDSTTNGYDGALFNSPSYTDGKFGQSITGFNYNVYPTFPNIPNGITNQSNNDSTISVWFSLTQMPAVFCSLFDKTSTDGSIVPTLSVILKNAGVNTIQIQISRGYNGTYWTSGYFGTKTIVLGELYHLVIDYTASTKTGNVYINNEFYGAYTQGFVNNYTIADGFNIGAYVGNGASTYAQYALQGRVDQLRIFGGILTAEQRTDLYDEVYCVP